MVTIKIIPHILRYKEFPDANKRPTPAQETMQTEEMREKNETRVEVIRGHFHLVLVMESFNMSRRHGDRPSMKMVDAECTVVTAVRRLSRRAGTE